MGTHLELSIGGVAVEVDDEPKAEPRLARPRPKTATKTKTAAKRATATTRKGKQ